MSGSEKVTFKRRKTNGKEELDMLVEDKFGNTRVEQCFDLDEVIQDEDQIAMLRETSQLPPSPMFAKDESENASVTGQNDQAKMMRRSLKA